MTAQHNFWLGKRKFSASWASGVYPVEVVDAVSPALTLIEARLVDPPVVIEGVSTGLSVTGGSLSTVLVGAQDLAAVSTSLTLTSGTLVNALAAVTLSPEDAVSPALTLTAGTLATVLIRHTTDTEGVSTALTLTGGTLA